MFFKPELSAAGGFCHSFRPHAGADNKGTSPVSGPVSCSHFACPSTGMWHGSCSQAPGSWPATTGRSWALFPSHHGTVHLLLSCESSDLLWVPSPVLWAGTFLTVPALEYRWSCRVSPLPPPNQACEQTKEAPGGGGVADRRTWGRGQEVPSMLSPAGGSFKRATASGLA